MFWKATIRSPYSLLLSSMINPNCLSLSLSERCFITLIIFVVLCWTCSNTSFLLRTPKLDAILQVGSHESRGAKSPLSICFWCSPGWSCTSALWVHVASPCSIFHPLALQSPSPQDWSQPPLLQLKCRTFCLALLNLGPTPWACQGPFGWHSFPHSPWCFCLPQTQSHYLT